MQSPIICRSILCATLLAAVCTDAYFTIQEKKENSPSTEVEEIDFSGVCALCDKLSLRLDKMMVKLPPGRFKQVLSRNQLQLQLCLSIAESNACDGV